MESIFGYAILSAFILFLRQPLFYRESAGEHVVLQSVTAFQVSTFFDYLPAHRIAHQYLGDF
jgi:hypothetical protein